MNSKLKEQINSLFERRVSGVPLAIFRILFSFSLLIEIIQIAYFRHLLFDPIPYEQVSRIPPEPLLLFWALAAFLLLIGYKTRYAAIVNYIFQVIIIGFSAMEFDHEWHVDSLLITCSIFLLFAPVDNCLSINSLIRKNKRFTHNQTRKITRVSYINYFILTWIIGVIYIDSVFYKLTSTMYLSGLGLWAPASLPYNTYLDLSVILNSEFISRFMGYFALLFELLFIFIVWFKKVRPVVVLLGIVFHIGIAIVFPLPVFSLVMIALFLGILDANVYHKISSLVNRILIRVKLNQLISQSTEEEETDASSGISKNNLLNSTQSETAKNTSRLINGSFIIIFFISSIIIHFNSPFYKTYLPALDKVWNKAGTIAATYKKFIYPWTGFSTHGVFMDQHFADYTSQMMLEYKDDNSEEPLPIIDQNGQVGIYNTARQWALWSFRTVRPGISTEKRRSNLIRFVEFWEEEKNIVWNDSKVIIKWRPINVSLYEWQSDLLKENMNQPWKAIGYIEKHDNSFEITWTDKEVWAKR